MKYTYDFHIHTALSPCGDECMTPNNIINMCKLNEIDIIAITDHNACGNCEAVMSLGQEKNILVIPGMEIESMEEFHSIALFPNIATAKYVEKILEENMLKVKNKSHIFGNQYLLDKEDHVIGEEELLLVTAIQLEAITLYRLVRGVGGAIYPAHIDRSAYSILSNLGSIPEELVISIAEISQQEKEEIFSRKYPELTFLSGSDAHYLEQLCEARAYVELENLSIDNILKNLQTGLNF